MDKEAVFKLLHSIKENKLVGITSIEIISYCIDEGLIEHITTGNFKLSPKGEKVLSER